MRITTSGLLAALVGCVSLAQLPAARGAVIAEYNFGSSNSSTETLTAMETPTATATNISAGNLTLGPNTGPATDDGSAVSSYYTSPGPNYLSVDNDEAAPATNDSTFYVDFVVTAASGYVFTPTGFSLVGGAGGSSNTRSFLLFDNVDGLPSSVSATTGAPTVSGGDEIGSGTFTAVRSTGAAMNSFTDSFPSSDQNLSSLEVRVYFDTQANGENKNIDLGSLTLSGTVSAVPEPCGCLSVAAVALLAGRRGRRRRPC